MIQDPAHAVTGIWDVVRELMPVLTFLAMGLATWFLNRLNKGQKVATTAAVNAATAAGTAADTAQAAAVTITSNARRREDKLDVVAGTVAETHTLVNGQRSEMQAKIDALQAQLRAAGVEPS